jgi:hypothetical protein
VGERHSCYYRGTGYQMMGRKREGEREREKDGLTAGPRKISGISTVHLGVNLDFQHVLSAGALPKFLPSPNSPRPPLRWSAQAAPETLFSRRRKRHSLSANHLQASHSLSHACSLKQHSGQIPTAWDDTWGAPRSSVWRRALLDPVTVGAQLYLRDAR